MFLEMSSRLLIRHLQKNIAETQLRESFTPFGDVTDVKIIRNRETSESRGFGFVGFKNPDQASRAFQALQGSFIGTSKISLDFAKEYHPSSDKAPIRADAFDSSLDDSSYLLKHVVRDWESDRLESNWESKEDDSFRLRVVNLPYACSESDLEDFFRAFGSVRDTRICLDEATGQSRGFGFVHFVFATHAKHLLESGKELIFQGRRLRIEKARDAITRKTEKNVKSYSGLKRERIQEQAADMSSSWNLLYVSANAAVAATARDSQVQKSHILATGEIEDNVAVRAALAETEIIQKTKDWLVSEGIDEDVFRRTGKSLVEEDLTNSERSKTTLIIKHLPVEHFDEEHLKGLFSRFGRLSRFALAPSRTVGIVEFCDCQSAKTAFQALSYRRFGSVPLYIEFAPEKLFSISSRASPVAQYLIVEGLGDLTAAELSESLRRRGFITHSVEIKPSEDEKFAFVKLGGVPAENVKNASDSLLVGHRVCPLRIAEQDSVPVQHETKTTRLLIRNVAFEASVEDIRNLFSSYFRVLSVRLPMKTGSEGHRGFAFVEMRTTSDAADAIEKFDGTHLYGRPLRIESADPEASSQAQNRKRAKLVA
jgi:multiple RNA-binding domain-containing protein 1